MNDEFKRVSVDERGDGADGPCRLGPAIGRKDADAEQPHHPSGQIGDKYRILEELGRGQMGVVYRAIQSTLNREVAVKFPRMVNQKTPERFLRESRVLASLSHPNLVRVLDADLDAGKPYLVLEFVVGHTLLAYRAWRGSLTIVESVGLICQVVDGLAAAHSEGIVHRDIKSGNVLVTPDGVAKLADFGLARTSDSKFTARGQLLGSPGYMSPETALGDTATAHSDIYSVGVVLFELLTGRLPFVAHSPGELLRKQAQDPPPKLAAFVEDVPPQLEMVYSRCLEKDPEKRPAGAAELGRMLREAVGVSVSTAALDLPALAPQNPVALPPPSSGGHSGRHKRSTKSPVPSHSGHDGPTPGASRKMRIVAVGLTIGFLVSIAVGWLLLR